MPTPGPAQRFGKTYPLLTVQSRHLMGCEGEPFGFGCPLFADELVRGEALEGFEPASEVVGVDEVLEMQAQLVVIIVVEGFDGVFIDGPVHAFHLTVRPEMLHLCQTMFDGALIADPIEDVVEGVFVTGLVGELDAVVGQHRMDSVGHCRDQVAQELGRGPSCRLSDGVRQGRTLRSGGTSALSMWT